MRFDRLANRLKLVPTSEIFLFCTLPLCAKEGSKLGPVVTDS